MRAPAAALVLASLLALGCSAPAGGSGGDAADRVAGEYLVTLADGAEPAALREALGEYGVTEVEALGRGRYRVRLEEDPGPDAVRRHAAGHPAVEAVQPNYRYRTFSEPRPRTLPSPGTAEALAGGQHCQGPDEPHARWLDDRAALADALRAAGADAAGSLDFQRRAAVAVHMGRRSSAGYGLSLAETPWRVADGVATLTLRWRAPTSGGMAAAVITRPCLVVAVPRGGYDTLRVQDTAGRTRLRAALPGAAR